MFNMMRLLCLVEPMSAAAASLLASSSLSLLTLGDVLARPRPDPLNTGRTLIFTGPDVGSTRHQTNKTRQLKVIWEQAASPRCHFTPKILHCTAPFPPKLSFKLGNLLWPTRPTTPDCTSIELAIFPQYTLVTNVQTKKLTEKWRNSIRIGCLSYIGDKTNNNKTNESLIDSRFLSNKKLSNIMNFRALQSY